VADGRMQACQVGGLSKCLADVDRSPTISTSSQGGTKPLLSKWQGACSNRWRPNQHGWPKPATDVIRVMPCSRNTGRTFYSFS
jgi:hypothetical protein